MPTRFASALSLLLLCAPCFGQKLELPQEVTGDVGAFIRVDARTDGKVVYWVALDQGLNVFPNDLLKVPTSTVVTAGKAGKYRIMAYTALGDQPSPPAYCTVVVGQPDPGPGPGPAPPGPDEPLTAFEKDLKKAYDDDQGVQKKSCARALADFYDKVAPGLASDAKNVTAGSLALSIRESLKTVVGDDCLKDVRSRIDQELAAVLPTKASDPLTPEIRSKAADAFVRVAQAVRRATK